MIYCSTPNPSFNIIRSGLFICIYYILSCSIVSFCISVILGCSSTSTSVGGGTASQRCSSTLPMKRRRRTWTGNTPLSRPVSVNTRVCACVCVCGEKTAEELHTVAFRIAPRSKASRYRREVRHVGAAGPDRDPAGRGRESGGTRYRVRPGGE